MIHGEWSSETSSLTPLKVKYDFNSTRGPESARLDRVDIKAVIAALGTRFDPDEATIAERLLREYGGTVPDGQLVEEIGFAIAIHRRQSHR